MSRYKYYVTQHMLNGNVLVSRKGLIFDITVARYHHNEEGWELARKHCQHLNTWFGDGWWSNTRWL